MTESEWQSCSSSEPLVEWLRGKGSDRKFRLFACACCRRISDLLDGWTANLLNISEESVDGIVSDDAIAFASDLHSDVISKARPYTGPHIAAGIVNQIRYGAAWPLACNVGSEVRRAIRHSSRPKEAMQETDAQVAILRDIFGNPFRNLQTSRPTTTSAVVAMAQAIYDTRQFNRLPLLADALQESGCKHPQLLEHLREPSLHVRGCWALDLILGKS